VETRNFLSLSKMAGFEGWKEVADLPRITEELQVL
jgi:hypothetical protein